MDWQSVLNPQGGQGTVFWFASAALAAGVSLIVAATILQVKHLFVRAGKKRTKQGKKSDLSPIPAADIAKTVREQPAPVQVTETGYRPGRSAAATWGTEANPTLAVLLKRLQTAADLLERMSGEIFEERETKTNSSLKQPSSQVEYLHKANRAQ